LSKVLLRLQMHNEMDQGAHLPQLNDATGEVYKVPAIHESSTSNPSKNILKLQAHRTEDPSQKGR
jgi:hypothetical protein